MYLYDPLLSPEEQRIRLAVTPSVAMQRVTFYVDGLAVGTVRRAPWEVWWALRPGEHVVTAEGVTADGTAYRTEEMRFTVKK